MHRMGSMRHWVGLYTAAIFCIHTLWTAPYNETIRAFGNFPPEPYLALSVRYWRACAVKVTFRTVARLLGEIPPSRSIFRPILWKLGFRPGMSTYPRQARDLCKCSCVSLALTLGSFRTRYIWPCPSYLTSGCHTFPNRQLVIQHFIICKQNI
jgi:hypothetical protein